MEKKRLIELGEFLNKSVFDGSLKTNDAFAEGIILFTQESVALLKEQEEQIKTRDESLEKAREEIKWLRGMLKEQEAVEPIPYHRSDGTIFKYECMQCRTKIFKMDLFCRHCGRPVKWDG